MLASKSRQILNQDSVPFRLPQTVFLFARLALTRERACNNEAKAPTGGNNFILPTLRVVEWITGIICY